MTIPRTAHFIHLGPAPLPEAVDLAVERLPGWNVIVWRGFGNLQNQDLYDRAANWSQKSDVARYEVLQRCGGFYLDTDVEVLRDLEPFTRCVAGFVVGRDPDPDYYGSAVIGAEAGHGLLGLIVGELRRSFDSGTGYPASTGPAFLTRMLIDREVAVLPSEAFYPYDGEHKERAAGPFPDSYAVHRWAASWLEPAVSR